MLVAWRAGVSVRAVARPRACLAQPQILCTYKGITGTLGIKAEADHTTESQQCFGSGPGLGFTIRYTRPDVITGNIDGHHWYWGSNMDFSWNSGKLPSAFYTY